MNKVKILFFLLISSSFIVLGQDTLNQVDEKNQKHGAWVVKHKNGSIQYEATFEHGNPIGPFTRYSSKGKKESVLIFTKNGTVAHATLFHPNGKKLAEGKYVNKEKDSTWSFYSDEGILIETSEYKLGKLNGQATKFYKNGVAKEKSFYNENGQLDSLHEEFYENGNIRSSQTLKNGAPDGPFKLYYSNKVYRTIGKYNKGKKDGTWKYYSPQLKLEKEEKYKNGEIIYTTEELITYWDDSTKVVRTREKYDPSGRSVLIAYHPNGQKSREGYYFENKKDSVWSYYDEAGNLSSIQTFYRGMKNGQWTFYHANGKVWKEVTWYKNKLDGDYKEYFPSGKPKTIGFYIDGAEKKEWLYYNENGEIIKRENKE